MNKDVIISIAGIQPDVDNKEPIEVISPGKFYERGGKRYVQYEEYDDSYNSIKCMIKIDRNHIEISKKGAYNSCMLFEKDKKCMTAYDTPYGQLMVGITTTDLIFLEDKDAIVIKIIYTLDINYEFVSECTVDIKILSTPIKE